MIEIVSPSLCTGCNICVKVCPTGVFDAVRDSIPMIARQHDCQTCFMCELYCPSDALYVSPMADESVVVAESLLQQRGLMGSYRRAVGWKGGLVTTADEDHSYALLTLARQRPA
jgi:NAD-dependent dihydropyrimidine dehydrogenase PreA subunit